MNDHTQTILHLAEQINDINQMTLIMTKRLQSYLVSGRMHSLQKYDSLLQSHRGRRSVLLMFPEISLTKFWN